MDLTGIKNENEFYSEHYLTAILEQDLKEVLAAWREQDKVHGEAPPTRLNRFAKNYFAFREAARLSRSADERLGIQREALHAFLQIAGYNLNPTFQSLDDDSLLPLLGEIRDTDGTPALWLLEALPDKYVDADERYAFNPLEARLQAEQYTDPQENHAIPDVLKDHDWEDLISKQVFSQAEPPRWLLLCSLREIVLMDRRKWNEKKLLRFDIEEILGRKERSAMEATLALLHKESLCPEGKEPLLDELDEKSHRHAYAVTGDLKEALRESIEAIGNEAVYYFSQVWKQQIYDLSPEDFAQKYKIKVPDGLGMADILTREALRYMYRLLFLFYIEARPELGYAPINSSTYLKGYSLESLRELELVQLSSEESYNGYYFHHTLSQLFEMVYEGMDYRGKGSLVLQTGIAFDEAHQVAEDAEVQDFYAFRMTALDSHLFDPERTPLLNKVKFRNHVLQKVIALMSLNKAKSKRDRRGRISYAQLGISQLGQVYEALLSYRGFFAETDLYEVKRAGEDWNPLHQGFFVKAEDLHNYKEDEKVTVEGQLVKHTKGKFIYRLAGRDRQKSASYYTPEVLTQCLVKYALKELLEGKTADEILELTVCEPAMGSAAFLNEAINQLSEAYLTRKQAETGISIPHDQMLEEKQRVKMYIVDNNVFGVDLNPVAVELAEVSLWLNTICKSDQGKAFVPWFGLQLVAGNSLIGSRREVYSPGQLTAEYWNSAPTRIPLGSTTPRLEDGIWHFLLPDPGMAKYDDQVIKELAPTELELIKKWRTEFLAPLKADEVARLQQLSQAIEALWQRHAKDQHDLRQRTTDPLRIFGRPLTERTFGITSTRDKDKKLAQEYRSEDVRNSSAYRRLKMVMDYWCALWFWPIEQAAELPSRWDFIDDITWMVDSNLFSSSPQESELPLFAESISDEVKSQYLNQLGVVELAKIVADRPSLQRVQALAQTYRFLHWELEFADIFDQREGFDLVMGNPPWIKVSWNESGILGDDEPRYVIQNFSSPQLSHLRAQALEKKGVQSQYLKAFEEATVTQNFLNGVQNYPLLRGIQTNLYKCFLTLSWSIAKPDGVQAFIMDKGIYNDTNGGKLREAAYPKLKYWFNFKNEKKLFDGIGNAKPFELSIYGSPKAEPSFKMIGNLFHPITIDLAFAHNGFGSIPGIKDDENNWSILGHKNRIVDVNLLYLQLFAELYDEPGTPSIQARLPVVHSKQVIEVLRKFASQLYRLGDLQGEYHSTEMWHETNSQNNEIIQRLTQFPIDTGHWILSGPNIYVGNPFHQTPRTVCETHRAYDKIDLTCIPDNYLPRTNYIPAGSPDAYLDRIPKVSWDSSLVTNYYRFVARRQLPIGNERTLFSAIIPKQVGHINPVISVTFKKIYQLIQFSSLSISVPYDFFIKIAGKEDFYESTLRALPLPNVEKKQILLLLNLVCLTTHYVELWNECWQDDFLNETWAKSDSRLNNSFFAKLTPIWQRECALRSDYARRQALVEIDVLAAMALGLILDELQTIYRIQFPVMRQNEQDTWYDQQGRIVFTSSMGLPGVGFDRKKWEEIKGMTSGTVERQIIDDTLPGGPVERTIVYHAPFDRCDREQDYATVWAHFEKRFENAEKES